MLQGTSSDAGKSLLTAALCRIYADRGLRVFPFKSQNMALNSFICPDGAEIGKAQALQAAAARRDPEMRMNPVLLKPESNSGCQVVYKGSVYRRSTAADYFSMKNELWSGICGILDEIRSENDLIIIEGAGSPAEINLRENDIVNMAVARYLKAPVLIAADIDLGGVFAFLYGTLELLKPEEKDLVKGFIINKFRGDISLLDPGLKMLSELTGGRRVLGVVPYIKDLLLAQEDSVFLDKNTVFGTDGLDTAVIRLPHISNYDDFDALLLEDGLKLRFVSSAAELGNPDWIIIPGTKTTIEDLYWLRQSGLAAKIGALAEAGRAVTGICGGYQILGKVLSDGEGLEGVTADVEGLGLLPLETVWESSKVKRSCRARTMKAPGLWSDAPPMTVSGYQIHMGRSRITGDAAPLLDGGDFKDGAVSESGLIWGTYMHGIFDTPEFRRFWLEKIGWKAAGRAVSLEQKRDQELDRLADTVRESMDMRKLDEIIGL